jgi:tetratricopeptide (TPR) repeat protein
VIFSDDFLFLHVPKAGGTSIVRYLMRVLPKPVYLSLPADHRFAIPDGVTRIDGVAHESLEEARVALAHHGRKLEDFPVVVACLRDPYELEVSRYAFLRRDLEHYNFGPQQAVALLGDFELFATVTRPHGVRQLESYLLLEGRTPPNLRVVRLENVAAELGACLRDAGVDPDATPIPHENRSPHEPFRSYYTATAEEAVYDKYRWVFDAGLYPRLDGWNGDPAEPRRDDVGELVEAKLSPLDAADDLARANVWLAAAEIHRHASRLAEQEDALERALAHAARSAADGLAPRIAHELARCRSLPGIGTIDAGIATATSLLELTPDGWERGALELMLSELLAAAGRFDDARRLCGHVRASRPELGLHAAAYAGSVELLAGEVEEAERRFAAGWWNPIGLSADRADCLWRLGREDEVERRAALVEATAPSWDVKAQARWRRLRAKLLARAGDAERAAALAHEALAIVRTSGAPNVEADALVDLAEVLALTRGDAQAADARGAAMQLYERIGNVGAMRRVAELGEAAALA